jgi:hypothetical protein
MRDSMKRRRLARWIGAGTVAGLLGCAGYFPQPEEHHLPYAARLGYPATLASLSEGRTVFIMKCDGCHGLPGIQKFSIPKWNRWLDSMKVEAELTPREDSLVRAYVLSSSGWLQDSLALEREKKAKEKTGSAPVANP